MVVIGGMRSFLGPALGALFFILFREFLVIYTETWLLYFGLMFVGFIVFSPTGLIDVAERLLRAFPQENLRRRRDDGAAGSNGCRCQSFSRPTGARTSPGAGSGGHIAKRFGGIKAVQGIDISRSPTARCTH